MLSLGVFSLGVPSLFSVCSSCVFSLSVCVRSDLAACSLGVVDISRCVISLCYRSVWACSLCGLAGVLSVCALSSCVLSVCYPTALPVCVCVCYLSVFSISLLALRVLCVLPGWVLSLLVLVDGLRCVCVCVCVFCV